jgi:dCMP deaminase
VVKVERRDKKNYYLDIAESVLERSTCLRRCYGAVIVKNDEIVSTGYNGAPRGRENCADLGYCNREKLEIPRGERYEMCRSVHAEQNAIISAGRTKTLGASLYIVGKELGTGEYVKNPAPCMLCKRFIINAGIKEIILRNTKDEYTVIDVNDYIENDDSLEGKFGY